MCIESVVPAEPANRAAHSRWSPVARFTSCKALNAIRGRKLRASKSRRSMKSKKSGPIFSLKEFGRRLQSGAFEKESRIVDRLLEQGFSSTDIACAVIHELRGEDSRPAETRPAGAAGQAASRRKRLS